MTHASNNTNFTILTLSDEEGLRDVFARFTRGDILSDPRYIRLFADYTGQRALYFHYKSERGEILLPFFERILPKTDDGATYGDLLSPWYYGGPIHTFTDPDEAQRAFAVCLRELHRYCSENRIISQFQRLNPALDNYRLYGDDAGLVWNRKVVSVDLRKSLETIRGEYDYKVRKNLKRAVAGGLRAVRGATPEMVRQFIAAYRTSMDRKNTGAFYYFNEKFFTDLFANFHEEVQLFVVYAGEEVAAASIVLGNGTILHDYLRAACSAFSNLRPSDFVVDAVIAWAKGAGYDQYSLGGGHSTAADDTLLAFKKSFSPLLKDFYVYKKVHDRDAYAKRCESEGKNPSELLYEKSEYFPEYKTL